MASSFCLLFAVHLLKVINVNFNLVCICRGMCVVWYRVVYWCVWSWVCSYCGALGKLGRRRIMSAAEHVAMDTLMPGSALTVSCSVLTPLRLGSIGSICCRYVLSLSFNKCTTNRTSGVWALTGLICLADCKCASFATFYPLSATLARYSLWFAMCLSVCHKSVFCPNDWTDRTRFLAYRVLQTYLPCVLKKLGYL